MHNFGTIFLWALAACILWDASFAKDQSGYICLIEEPKQNQRDSYCLTELSPRLNEVVKAQNKGNTNTRDAVNEIKSKLETLEVKIGEVQAKLPQEVYAKLEEQLQGVENKLEGRLQGLEGRLQEVQTKLEGQQTKMEAKLDESLLTVQKKIENQLQAVLNTLQAVPNKIDAAKLGVSASSTNTIPSGFELIGSRYFRIVEDKENWETAERRCREMGGYLASFRNEEEINAITSKLEDEWNYWLGINDQDEEGHYVSVASQKPATFLKWGEGEPRDWIHEWNCVFLVDGKMKDFYCSAIHHFICQADNET
ncbi:hypothetical protein KR059_006797 [Drosophila kikkawai]|nr:hypothetical protein KR059_006797 [Drosophila kikkawai]